jgi:hypothetical protein
MADESVFLSHLATWVIANGTSIGTVLLWVTKPIRDKIANFEERLGQLEKALAAPAVFEARLGAIEKLFGDPRASMPDVASPAELTRRMRDLEEWQAEESNESRTVLRRDIEETKRLLRELQQAMNHMVSDEEFRGYIAVTNQKTERIIESLGVIRGTLRLRASDAPR